MEVKKCKTNFFFITFVLYYFKNKWNTTKINNIVVLKMGKVNMDSASIKL